jgi:hypothetical protein
MKDSVVKEIPEVDTTVKASISARDSLPPLKHPNGKNKT